MRAALAAAQLINYHERFAFDARLLALLGRVFRAQRACFSAEYAHKTAAELKSAVEDRARATAAASVAAAAARAANGGGGGGDGSDDEGEDDEDGMDDALDAMLDAQMEAEGNLFDDFAEMTGKGQI